MLALSAHTDHQLDRFDPEAVRGAWRWFERLSRYHRLDVRHPKRMPSGPAVLVSNHNGGFFPVDGLFLVDHYPRTEWNDPVHILAHDILFLIPEVARQLNRLGIVQARRTRARQILERGRKLLVFPGGDVENMRAFRDRKRVLLDGRRGFARTAVRCGVPVVPIVSAGSHETLLILSSGRRLAERLGLNELARVRVLPTALALPWGLVWGPAVALPYLPLPAQVTVAIGEPIPPSYWADAPDEEEAQRMLHARTRDTMQTMLDELYAERTLPVLG